MTAVTSAAAAAAAPEDDREARFLASQSARLASASSSSGNNASNDGDDGESSRTEFWDAFRSCCTALSKELDAIASGESIALGAEDRGSGNGDGGNGSGNGEGASAAGTTTLLPAADGDDDGRYATASARAVATSRLDAAAASLRLLERRCLSTSSSLAPSPTSVVADKSSAPNEEDAKKRVGLQSMQLQLPNTAPDDLPPGDVRLLTTELASLRNRLEELRDDICPPELFVFRRYRAAMAAREREKNDDDDRGEVVASASTDNGMDGPAALATNPSGGPNDRKNAGEQQQQVDMEQHYGSSIVNETDCAITITDAAAIRCRCAEDGDDGSAGAVTTTTSLDAADAGSSLLIKDVERCRIVM